jgi:hypothetical protein
VRVGRPPLAFNLPIVRNRRRWHVTADVLGTRLAASTMVHVPLFVMAPLSTTFHSPLC